MQNNDFTTNYSGMEGNFTCIDRGPSIYRICSDTSQIDTDTTIPHTTLN